MNRFTTSLLGSVMFLSSAAIGLADTEAPPTICTDTSGTRYVWSSDQCAQARADWAKAHSTTATIQQTQIAPPVPAGATRLVLPGGTAVAVEVVDKVSSSNANIGDTFAVRAADDVVINGWVVVARGAPGQGEVLSVDRAGSHGHPGSLGVQIDWIFAVDGNKIHLTSQRSTAEGQSKAGVSSTVTIVSWAFLGLPGLFAHNFVKGRDVELDSSHPLQAFIDSSVYVVATAHGRCEAHGFAPTAPAQNAVLAPVPAPLPSASAPPKN